VVKTRSSRGFDTSRLLGALCLLGWAVFFDILWLRGTWVTFVGPRTAWIVPAGGIGLTATAIGYTMLALRRRPGPSRRPSLGTVLGSLVLVAPLLAFIAVPNAQLGALAVERKSTDGAGASTRNPLSTKPLDVIDIALASEDPEYGAARGARDGRPVKIVGFVIRNKAGGRFHLARFQVFCCAADAVPYVVGIEPTSEVDYKPETWLEVRGRLNREPGGELIVADAQPRQIPEPENPYIRG
jgi:uncharacterized repeat protein (TIGR03943 family)